MIGVTRSARAAVPATLPAISATVTSATKVVVASIPCTSATGPPQPLRQERLRYDSDDIAQSQSPGENRLGLHRVLRRQRQTVRTLLLFRIRLRPSRVRGSRNRR